MNENQLKAYEHEAGGPKRLLEERERLLNASRQALSDLTWIESNIKGSNLDSSIILLRDPINFAEEDGGVRWIPSICY